MGKFTDEELIDVIEQNPLATYEDIGKILGVTKQAIALRVKQLGGNGEIEKQVHSYCKRNAYKYIKYLEREAEKGKVDAIIKLLEMGGIYVPRSKSEQKVESKGLIDIKVSRVDIKRALKSERKAKRIRKDKLKEIPVAN